MKLFSASTKLRSLEEVISLNGKWNIEAKAIGLQNIKVPALWESEGFLNLDGKVVYTRVFQIGKCSDYSTLRFEGVMDQATVFLNGKELGTHHNPFTPFEIDTTGVLIIGKNELKVEVIDYPRDSPEHVRSAHGKQGWGNQEFPSPPSVYMTLGGVYRDVSVHLHRAVVIRNIRADCDPLNLKVSVELENVSNLRTKGNLELEIFGKTCVKEFNIAPFSRISIDLLVNSEEEERWSPSTPNLHEVYVRVKLINEIVDVGKLKFGLRSVRLENGKLLINGEPLFMKSALVQGFYPDIIYSEPSDELIRDEVAKAKSLGLNMLRLHIKAFDSRYLSICDEMGMLLHCDIPIAEPIAHLELDSNSLVAQNCEAAIRAQVYRDYSHPSIVLWSAMNELGLEKMEIRKSKEYENFVIKMFDTLFESDQTRPIIENDWIDPDPEYVFRSEILTSHWYGRLDSRYLSSLRGKCQKWGADLRLFFVSEFGDWGLPQMPTRDDKEFWSYHQYYDSCFKNLPWTASKEEFILGSQGYMGISDKLQIEVFRSTDGVDGYCITELTDIPWELNGLLDFRRNIKEEMAPSLVLANQLILPIIEFDFAGVERGLFISGNVHIHNTTNAEVEAVMNMAFKSGLVHSENIKIGPNSLIHSELPNLASTLNADLDILRIWLESNGETIGENAYLVPIYGAGKEIELPKLHFLTNDGVEILKSLGVSHTEDSHIYIVGEGALTDVVKKRVEALLAASATVLILAQNLQSSANMPFDVGAISSTTEWGGTDFHFTTKNSDLFGKNLVLGSQDLNIRPDVIYSRAASGAWPEETHVAVFKPMPRPRSGYIIGKEKVSAGILITCQYRLNDTHTLASTQGIARTILNIAS